MTRRKTREIAALPSGHVGVYRTDDGKQWEAYVAEKKTLRLLGIYATKRAAVTARTKYWKAKEHAH
jgi:endonuclease YncB( thermonuclease family)